MIDRRTWESRVEVHDPELIMAALRAAGLPLAYASEQEGEESDASRIVCVAAYLHGQIQALVATPSGLVYRFEPDVIVDDFWRFALNHYYVVTGNIADRLAFAQHIEVPEKAVKGRALIRKKSEDPSGLSLDDLLNILMGG